MSYLDPAEAFDNYRDRSLEAIKKQFPVDGRTQVLDLEHLEVQDNLDPDDIRGQHQAKVTGLTWGVPVIAHLVLRDKATGKEVRAKTRIAELPKVTRRHSQIVNGQEYQVDNQWQLKPGAYTRRKQTGEIETAFQSSNKPNFDVTFDDVSKEFKVEFGTKARIPLYPLLSTLGVHDEDLEKVWGKDVLTANKNARDTAGALARFYKTTKRVEAPSPAAAIANVAQHFDQFDMRPDATAVTLGRAADHVDGDVLLRATKRMLDVHAGAPMDDRDSLMFKDLRSVGDFSHDKIMAAGPTIRMKMLRKVNTSTNPREIVRPEFFNKPVRETFHKNAASKVAKQVNPVEMVSAAQQTTVMGPGGIQSENTILDEVKFVNPSHMCFLDPIHTPEGCFRFDTEVFTSKGWVKWPLVTRQDRLACLVDGHLTFERPLALVALPFKGELLCVDTTRVKQRGAKPLKYAITPKHRVWSRPVEGAGYRIEVAESMHGKMRVFQTGHAPYLGTKPDVFELPIVFGNGAVKNVGPIALGDWAEFLGWFLSEGYVDYDEEKYRYHVKLFQSELPGTDGCERIETLLSDLPFTWSKFERENSRMVYSICTKQLTSYLAQFGGSFEKFIPEEAFEWPVYARQRLLQSLMLGDGRKTQIREGDVFLNEVYTTTSPALAAGVERLLISLGYATFVRSYSDNREERYKDVYEVRIFQNPERHIQRSHLASYYKEKYKGMVYCAEVPGSLVFVRLPGSIGFWSGNSMTGVTLRMPLGVRKVGNEPQVPLYNMKTGEMEYIGPTKFLKSRVVLPDQVEWKGKKPHAKSVAVKWSAPGNEITEGHLKDADYVMRHPSQFFNVTSNLIPFINNTSGGRASMATRHMEQAISLEHREAPLVQVGTGRDRAGARTFEEVIGTQASHQSPVDGVIKSVKHDAIVVTDAKGIDHEVQTYHNYPLNDAKSVLDSEPLVKPGDKVKREQTIADTNFSKNGTIALGTNLRVAYIPYKGYNFEDGVVVSESAAKKLSSVHLYKHNLSVDDETVLAKGRYLTQHIGRYNKDQVSTIGDDGLVRVGTKVLPGDPLVLAMKKSNVHDRVGLSAIRKSLGGQYADQSLTWEGEGSGEVVSSFKKGNEIVVHVKSIEPMQVGDKIAGRYGNKGICFDPETQVLTGRGWKYFYDVTDDDEICTRSSATGRIEYQEPTRRIALDYNGRMYRFEGRRLDLMTTPEHKHFVRTAKDASYGLESAESCFGYQRVHLRTGEWAGAELQTIVIPGRAKDKGSKEHFEFCNSREYDADDFLEFFGYWVTEGSLDDSSHISLGQRYEVNWDIWEKMLSVVTRMGYTAYQHADGIVISDPRLHRWLQQFGKSLDKFIPREFLLASKRQLKILVDALFDGDGGDYFREKDNHTRHELFTSSARLADDYQELALKLGMSANVKPQQRDGRNTEYVVRWTAKDEVYTTKDSRYASHSEYWVEYTGKVYCVEVPNHVIYVRRNGIPVWSGNCTRIISDENMPHTPDGAHIEVALNPSGVPGRMNVGQVLETAASKIAKKTGKPYVVDNFDGTNQLANVQRQLKEHGISDVEALYDPTTKQHLGDALVGYQHMIKLHHQVDKKVSVRSGLNLPGSEPVKYDTNLQPSGGGHSGGQSMDPLGLYALLAHGARANIREMQTWKSEGPDPNVSPQKQWQSQHHDVWDAIQQGDALPTPKPTFAFKKFTDMLKGSGINIEKQGHQLILTPLTDKNIRDMTGDRVLPKPAELLYAKPDPKSGEPRPKPGGLFDEKLTGGHGGKKWSRIELSEPIPNPVFESSIRALTGLSADEYNGLVQGTQALDKSGNFVPLGKGITGGAAVHQILSKIEVDADLIAAKKELNKVSATKVDKVLKKVKRLQALKDAGITPADAYILHNLPVIPPAMRPITTMPDGNFKYADINELYSQFAQNNDQMKDPVLTANLTDENKSDLRKNLYDGVKAIMGVGIPYADAEHKGLIHQIHGAQPKTGYFQSTLISRKQDMSMRSTIVPEPSLSLDEVGLPAEHAMRLFAPFVVGQLKKSGVASTVIEAQRLVSKNSPQAQRALQQVMSERPVMLKRDPALHKYSVQAFRPRVVEGNAIKIHPLVTGGYNADFDGDTMSVFVPISAEAVSEAKKMFPSNNLFSEASGRVMYQPTLESALGLYKLSRVDAGKTHEMKHPADALMAVQHGKISVTSKVKIGTQVTTPGRILMAAALPEPMQKKMLEDLHLRLNGDGLDHLLTQVVRNHSDEYGSVADKLKDIGNGAASGVVTVEHSGFVGANRLDSENRVYVPVGVHTLGLADFTPDIATRERVLAPARKEVAAIRANVHLSDAKADREAIRVWTDASTELKKKHLEKATGNPSNLMMMHLAGVKPGWDQYKQLTLAPMLVKDASGKTIPIPITRSYAEGLDTGEYWTQMHGARHGAVMKVQEVREPGYLSKLLMANTMDMVVTGHDCGTTRGISLPITDSDVHDRFLQSEFNVKGMVVPAGTLLTPNIVSKMRAADRNAKIDVRSPLKCEHAKGVCQKCMGISAHGQLHDIGENVGVVAAQSLGERAVQLTMKVFHTGGSVSTGGSSKVLGGFERFDQLMKLPKNIKDSATLAMRSGTVEKVEKDTTGVNVYIGGRKHHVGKDASGLPLWRPIGDEVHPQWTPPHVGAKIEKGQLLSDPTRTVVNPHDLYKATGNMESVQNYMADEVHKLYKDEGIKRQHIETVVKAMSNLTKIKEPGDYEGVLRGEFHPTSKISAINRELVQAGKLPIEHEPVLKGVAMMPLSVQEDWMAKMNHIKLHNSLLEAAATGGRSNLHGLHPVPAMAYGAEFGLNQEHARSRLSLAHLHDVPKAAY